MRRPPAASDAFSPDEQLAVTMLVNVLLTVTGRDRQPAESQSWVVYEPGATETSSEPEQLIDPALEPLMRTPIVRSQHEQVVVLVRN